MFLACPICSELINQTDNITTTKCGHLFHNSCISKWIEMSKNCPQCRQFITPNCLIRAFPNTRDLEPAGDNIVFNVEMKLRGQEQALIALNNEREEERPDLQAYQKDMKTLKTKMAMSNTQIEVFKQHLISMQQQLSFSEAENERLKEENEQLRTFGQNIMAELSGAKHQSNALITKLRTNRQELADLKLKYEELRGKYSAYVRAHEFAEENNIPMKKDISSCLYSSWSLNPPKVTPPAQKVTKKSATMQQAAKQKRKTNLLGNNTHAPVAMGSNSLLKVVGSGNPKVVTDSEGKKYVILDFESIVAQNQSSPDQRIKIFHTVTALPNFHADNAQSTSKMDISNDGFGEHSI